MSQHKKLAILVGGGPAPGINSVISAASIRALLDGVEVVGIRDGFEWIMEGNIDHVVSLHIDEVSRIHFRGGSHIGISRANPTRNPQHLENTVISLLRLNVSQLITIGGDDTAYSAMKLEEKAGGRIRVVHVPKTIDNDLDLPPYVDTFGFQTARHNGVEIVKNLMVDAKTTSRWYFVIAMGRKAGHLALGIGKAAGATLTLIPEEFAGQRVKLRAIVDTLVGAIIKRLSYGRRDGVAVIAEGLVLDLDPDDLAQLDDIERDAHGNVRIAEVNIGEILKAEVTKRLKTFGLKATIVAKNIGYELRCADPIPLDMEYTRDLGYCAAKYLLSGGNAVMISMQGGHFVPIPFRDLLDPDTGRARIRLVDINSTRYAIARRYMIRLRRDDFEDPHELAKFAATAGMSLQQFRAEFETLIEREPPPLHIAVPGAPVPAPDELPPVEPPPAAAVEVSPALPKEPGRKKSCPRAGPRMHLSTLDWVIVVGSIALSFVPAILMARRAGSSTAEFFTSGRAAPWWLVGVSMVATTFSTDTPNLVTNLVRERGVANNWVWWAFLLTGMMTVFFYARLWRRSGVLTDLEFYELRYAGRAASFVRGFRSLYLGLFFNLVIMASVNLAAAKIANVLLGWPMWQTLVACAVLTVAFAAVSGLWGVLVTDFVQFGIAMTGSLAAAYFALRQPEVGGLSGLVAQIDPATLRLLPDFGDWSTTLAVLVIPLTVQWWSVWYPGAEPGGGSYIAQRMLASRSERDAMAGTLLFNVAHYAIRPWPWILVGLASMVVYPELDDLSRALPYLDARLIGHDMAYPAMLRFLPSGFLGLMVAGLLAAYVSTISTHLNWGTSYLVHDFYRRFLRPDATERHYVLMGRLATVGLMALAAGFTFVLDTARQSFELLMTIGAGTGLIYLLRWFWWRINAWSEVAAMASSFVVALGFFLAARRGVAVPSHVVLLVTVATTTAVWVATTFLTPPTDRATLERFYRVVRPAGPGWAALRRETGLPASPDSLTHALAGWVLGCSFVYAALFGAGSLIYGRTAQAFVWLVVFLVSAAGLLKVLPVLWRSGEGHPAA